MAPSASQLPVSRSEVERIDVLSADSTADQEAESTYLFEVSL